MRREHIRAMMRPAPSSARRWKAVSLVASDLAAVAIAVGLSLMVTIALRRVAGLSAYDFDSSGFTLHLVIIGAFTGALLLWFRSKGHYRRRQALVDQLGSIVGGCTIAMLCAAAAQFATVEVGSRALTVSYWLLLVPGLILSRALTRKSLRHAEVWASPAVLFTCASRASQIADLIRKRSEIGAHVESVITTNDLSQHVLVDSMREASRAGAIVIYAPSNGDPLLRQVVEQLVLGGIPFIMSPEIGPMPNHAEILEYPPEEISLIEVRDPLARPLALGGKRAIDIAVTSLALVFALPVLVPIVLAIRADGGPALFRQERVGRKGEVFGCLKFRSMVVNAEERLQHMIETDPGTAAEWKAFQKLRKDPRITRVGQFIRKTNLDELPQLINVLKGDMSLVGPRPMTVPQIEDYGTSFEAYKRVRPGITGLWQTNGRNATTFAERARLDAWYVRNWSLWRDFVILVRTVREVILARGN